MKDSVYWIGPAAIVRHQEVHPVTYIGAADPGRGLPSIDLVVPIQRMAAGSRPVRIDCIRGLEYPRTLLSVTVVMDGPCPESEPGIVRHADAMQAEGLEVRVVRHPRYRGQIAVLDEVIAGSRADVVALSELFAPLPCDVLLKLANVHLNSARPDSSADILDFPPRP